MLLPSSPSTKSRLVRKTRERKEMAQTQRTPNPFIVLLGSWVLGSLGPGLRILVYNGRKEESDAEAGMEG